MRAVEHVQRHARRESGEVLGAGAAERPRPHVGVAEGEHGRTRRAERLEQFDAAEGQLLSVVDEDGAEPPGRAPRGRGGRKGAGEADRLAHEARRVAVRTAQAREHRLVVGRERRECGPHLALLPLPARGQDCGVDPEGRALGEEGAQLGAEPARGADVGAEPPRPAPRALELSLDLVVGVPVEQVLHDAVFIGAGEQLRLRKPGMHGVGTHELIGDRRERAGERARGGDPHLEGEAVAQHRRRLPGRGQHEHLVGGEPRLEQRAHPRDDSRGLSRAGSADDDARRGRRERDDGALSGIEGHASTLSGASDTADTAAAPAARDAAARRVRRQRAASGPRAEPRPRRVS